MKPLKISIWVTRILGYPFRTLFMNTKIKHNLLGGCEVFGDEHTWVNWTELGLENWPVVKYECDLCTAHKKDIFHHWSGDLPNFVWWEEIPVLKTDP